MEQPSEMMDSDVVQETPSEPTEVSQDVVEDVDTSESPETVEDDEEIDYDGEKYKVPKKLKEAFLRQQDYTRKTQEVAETRKSIEAERQAFQQQQQLTQKHIEEVAEAMSLNKQLQQYQQIDWKQLIDQDPVQAMKLDREMRSIQEQLQGVGTRITQRQQQEAMQQSQATARQLQEAAATLEREIPEFSKAETKAALKAAGQAIGYSPEDLANITDPRAVKLLHKAMLYDKLIAEKKQAAKPEAEPVKPVTRIAAKRQTAVDPDKLSTDDWLKWRNSQLRRA